MTSSPDDEDREPALPSVGDRVPSAALVRHDGGRLPLRHMGREATVLVRLHDGSCQECLDYVSELDAASDRFRHWYARLVVVVPGGRSEAREAAGRVQDDLLEVAADPENEGPTAGTDGPGAVVFDRFGEVYHAEPVEDHAYPDADAIRSWLVYLATQCPECGVPDRP